MNIYTLIDALQVLHAHGLIKEAKVFEALVDEHITLLDAYQTLAISERRTTAEDSSK